MSDSPAFRPQRHSSLASFYVDEDDVENVRAGQERATRSKKKSNGSVDTCNDDIYNLSSNETEDLEIDDADEKGPATTSSSAAKSSSKKTLNTKATAASSKSNAKKPAPKAPAKNAKSSSTASLKENEPARSVPKPEVAKKIALGPIEKVKLPSPSSQANSTRRVGLSRSGAPKRPLSPVKILKFSNPPMI